MNKGRINIKDMLHEKQAFIRGMEKGGEDIS